LFSWKQFEWMNFSHLTRRRPQSDAVASVEDFDDVRAEKTPPAVRENDEKLVFSAIA
jgi:hypothetical protein